MRRFTDSTINLLGGNPLIPVMNFMRDNDDEPTIRQEMDLKLDLEELNVTRPLVDLPRLWMCR